MPALGWRRGAGTPPGQEFSCRWFGFKVKCWELVGSPNQGAAPPPLVLPQRWHPLIPHRRHQRRAGIIQNHQGPGCRSHLRRAVVPLLTRSSQAPFPTKRGFLRLSGQRESSRGPSALLTCRGRPGWCLGTARPAQSAGSQPSPARAPASPSLPAPGAFQPSLGLRQPANQSPY